jgi:hypothetical protein
MPINTLGDLEHEMPFIFGKAKRSQILDTSEIVLLQDSTALELSAFELELVTLLPLEVESVGMSGLLAGLLTESTMEASQSEWALTQLSAYLARKDLNRIGPHGVRVNVLLLGGQSGAHFGTHLPVATPDVWAFYREYHFDLPMWGIYLTATGWLHFTILLRYLSLRRLSDLDCALVARHFLFRHEQFHHNVEHFATRLEISHQKAFFRTGFERRYRSTFGTAACLEESLANAYAFRHTVEAFKNHSQINVIRQVLSKYIEASPDGYRQAINYLTDDTYEKGTWALMNEYFQHSVPRKPRFSDSVWDHFGHALHGIVQVNSRVAYLVPNSRQLHLRAPLGRPMAIRDLKSKLRGLGCTQLPDTNGPHERWQGPNGKPFSLPRHHDIPRGTIASILRQLGLGMNLFEFLTSQ